MSNEDKGGRLRFILSFNLEKESLPGNKYTSVARETVKGFPQGNL